MEKIIPNPHKNFILSQFWMIFYLHRLITCDFSDLPTKRKFQRIMNKAKYTKSSKRLEETYFYSLFSLKKYSKNIHEFALL